MKAANEIVDFVQRQQLGDPNLRAAKFVAVLGAIFVTVAIYIKLAR